MNTDKARTYIRLLLDAEYTKAEIVDRFRVDGLAPTLRDQREVARLIEVVRDVDTPIGIGAGAMLPVPRLRPPGRPKGTRTHTQDNIVDVFRALRDNYGRAPTQRELCDNLDPRIEPRALQDHLREYNLGWPIE